MASHTASASGEYLQLEGGDPLEDTDLKQEVCALRSFPLGFGLLPLLEWASIPVFLHLGRLWSSGLYYTLLLASFSAGYSLKRELLHRLADNCGERSGTADDVRRVLNGETDFVGQMFKSLFGAFPGEVFMLVKSMPLFMESLTLAYALPAAMDIWRANPSLQETWERSWSVAFLKELNPPLLLWWILVVGTILHVVTYYVNLSDIPRACDFLVKQAEQQPTTVVVLRRRLSEPPADVSLTASQLVAAVQNSMWDGVLNSAGIGNLSLVVAVVRERREATQALLPAECRGTALLREKELMCIGGKSDLGIPRLFFRLLLTCGMKAWLNVSTLMDLYGHYDTTERTSVVLAILMSLLTIVLTLPDQFAGLVQNRLCFDSASAVGRYLARLLLFVAIADLLVALLLRVAGCLYCGGVFQLWGFHCL